MRHRNMKRIPTLLYFPFIAVLFTMVNCQKEEPVKEATLSTLSVTNITTNTAQSGGNITSDGGGDINSRGVVWGKSPNPTAEQNNGLTMDGSGLGLFQSNLTGLQSNTTYYVRAYATNEAGIIYGSEQQFTTEGIAPTVTTSQVTNITVNSATSGGDVNDEGGASVTARGVVWSTSQNPTLENNLGSTSNDSGTGSFTSNLTGLTANTIYYVRAYATNDAVTGYGQQESFTTIESTAGNIQPGEGVTDIEGNFYPSVIIGNQEWMAQNLHVKKYNNGNAIPTGLNDSDWSNTKDGAYSNYNNDNNISGAYGNLYNWYAVDDARGLCPTGWRVPTDADWIELVDYVIAQGFPNELNNPNGAGNALKSCRQVSSPLVGDCATSEHPRWNSHSTHYGKDEFGFSALPGGVRYDYGSFNWMGTDAVYWSSSEHDSTKAWFQDLAFHFGHVFRNNTSKNLGFSVRCVRD